MKTFSENERIAKSNQIEKKRCEALPQRNSIYKRFLKELQNDESIRGQKMCAEC